MRIGLVGGVNSSFVALKKLVEHEFLIDVVFGYEPKKTELVSGYNNFKNYCLDRDINYIPFKKINNYSKLICESNLDILFVVGVSQLISNEIIESPRLGCIGFHPTKLPKGRGRAPIAWMIQSTENGAASFFQIAEEADSGPIFIQEKFQIEHDDDAKVVESKILYAMEVALDKWLPELKTGMWNPVAQDHKKATEYGVRKRDDGLIDWSKPAHEIQLLIQSAAPPHPGAFTYFDLNELIILKSRLEKDLRIKGSIGRVLKKSDSELLLQTGDGLIWLEKYNAVGEIPRVGERLGYLSELEIHTLKLEILKLKEMIGNGIK